MVSKVSQKHLDITRKFLQTAVIVDDQAYLAQSSPAMPLEVPGRRTGSRISLGDVGSSTIDGRGLDAPTLVDTFARHGLICAVIAPRDAADSAEILPYAAREADIVILDWRLSGDRGETAQQLLRMILESDKGERLRLVAVYTGESDIKKIGRTIRKEVTNEWDFTLNDLGTALFGRHCRIVIYAKKQTQLPPDLESRSISETELPEHLIKEFAAMTEGLLPGIALASLAAIRRNVNVVLDKFSAELDAAFLTHRSCLHSPEDSQQHMVNQLAGELHGLMEDAVARECPADMEAIEQWLRTKLNDDEKFIIDTDKNIALSFEQASRILRVGLDRAPDQARGQLSKSQGFTMLSRGFSRGDDNAEESDLRLAWMMNFRTVFDVLVPPILHLGTVVAKEADEEKPKYYLCMRPRCDSLRLYDGCTERFLLLPLVTLPDIPKKNTQKTNTIQLVLRTDKSDNPYRRVGICTRMSKWILKGFKPNKEQGAVVAETSTNGTGFFFSTDKDVRFDWIGELKVEYAQRVAHHVASKLSRVAVSNSEWLRRAEQWG